MNFYASRDYLDAVAAVYFRGQHTVIEDVRIGDDVLRLLVVGGKRIITSHQFLDFHEPLLESEVGTSTSDGRYARSVVRRVIERDDWNPGAFPDFELAPYVDWSKFPNYDDYRAFLLKHHKSLV